MMNLELPKRLNDLFDMTKQASTSIMRPVSRKYDTIEHTNDIPELEIFGQAAGGSGGMAGTGKKDLSEGIKNGSNMGIIMTTSGMCYGDSALTMSIPGMGLGNAAIGAVATPEQKERFGKVYAAMAITEPGTGSDSANIQTTADLDGDEWIINGEKIFCTDGDRCSHIVVWATVDKSVGKAAIKSFVVPRDAKGLEVTRLEDKMGLRISDTAAITFTDCRIPKDNILGSPEVAKTAEERKKAFGGVMQTFDNTRPQVAAMSLGVARAALDMMYEILKEEGVDPQYDNTYYNSTALEAETYKMEADLEAARLLVLKAAYMADNNQPNSTEASISKAKAGRVGNAITLKCVELCGTLGYGHKYLLEKFARDSKILDIFEGTQQIQQLIVARNIMGLSSSELK
jgi:acyl-CoA dehydrogenase